MVVEIPTNSRLTPGGRTLGAIDKRSQTLLEKGKIVRVLDKARDSEEVVRLRGGGAQASYPRLSGWYRVQ